MLAEPFVQAELESAVARAAEPELAAAFSHNGIDYGRNAVPFDGLAVAADAIEKSPTTDPMPAHQ